MGGPKEWRLGQARNSDRVRSGQARSCPCGQDPSRIWRALGTPSPVISQWKLATGALLISYLTPVTRFSCFVFCFTGHCPSLSVPLFSSLISFNEPKNLQYSNKIHMPQMDICIPISIAVFGRSR